MASIIKADTLQSTTANVFILNSSGTEYARFDSSGNMGIGAASPNTTTKFYVEQSGGGNVLGYFNSTATAQNARLRINSTDNASSVAHVWSYSHASLNKQVSAYLTGAGALAIQAGQTAGSEPTTGTTSAIFNQYGIGLGGTNPSNGTGIAFPATQSASSDANTLDDYEEGTFTPTISAGAGTITTSTTGGWYVKVGRSVTFFAYWNVANIGSASGAMFLGGLPFTTLNTGTIGGGNRGALTIIREDALTGYLGQIFWASNGTTGQSQKYDGNNYTWTNGSVWITSGTYETAS